MVFGFFAKKSLAEDSTNADSNASASLNGSVPPQSPSPPPEDAARETHVGPTDLPSLYKLVKSMPPKVLHDYTVTRLRSDDDSDLASILSFYSDLKMPNKLHCVRCHQDYFEVDNTDRSCQIEHDDDSAEVERSGRRDSEYETHYGCCGRTVEGEGDMGPPDGWCYEGEHTTDPIRARFRADSSLRNPMLTPCTQRCGPTATATAGVRKRRRVQSESEATESEEEEEDSGVEEITGKKGKAKPTSPKKRAPKKSKVVQDEKDKQEPASAPQTPKAKASTNDSPASKPRKRTKKSAMVEDENEKMEASPPEKSKPRARPKKTDDMDVDIESSPKPKPTKTPTKRPAKVKADDDTKDVTNTESGPSPKPSVKSAMKGRPGAKPRSTAKRAKSLKDVVATSVDGED